MSIQTFKCQHCKSYEKGTLVMISEKKDTQETDCKIIRPVGVNSAYILSFTVDTTDAETLAHIICAQLIESEGRTCNNAQHKSK